MRKTYLILFLLFPFSLHAQNWYKELVTDRVTINQPDQTIIAFVKPVRHHIAAIPGRTYFWYSANQIRTTQGGYSGKLLNGKYEVYYPGKNLKEQGEFKKGLQHSEWTAWYENGHLKENYTWRSGRKSGPFILYDEKGDMTSRGAFSQGLLEGKLITYYGKDSSSVSYYREGKLFNKAQNPGFFKIAGQKMSDLWKKLVKGKRKEEKKAQDTSGDKEK